LSSNKPTRLHFHDVQVRDESRRRTTRLMRWIDSHVILGKLGTDVIGSCTFYVCANHFLIQRCWRLTSRFTSLVCHCLPPVVISCRFIHQEGVSETNLLVILCSGLLSVRLRMLHRVIHTSISGTARHAAIEPTSP
jgi:hypothetical protein